MLKCRIEQACSHRHIHKHRHKVTETHYKMGFPRACTEAFYRDTSTYYASSSLFLHSYPNVLILPNICWKVIFLGQHWKVDFRFFSLKMVLHFC